MAEEIISVLRCEFAIEKGKIDKRRRQVSHLLQLLHQNIQAEKEK